MKNIIFSLIFILISYSASANKNQWKYEVEKDSFTDEEIYSAITAYKDGINIRLIVVLCRSNKFEVRVGFSEYLNDSGVDVIYRIDSKPAITERWYPLPDGTSLKAKHHAELARLLMDGNSFIIKAVDYRGVSHEAKFSLAGSTKAINPVLKKCNASNVALTEQFPGVRHEIALELERWGPKNIQAYKDSLKQQGLYQGEINTRLDLEFVSSLQLHYDNYISGCKSGHIKGNNCASAKIIWSTGEVSYRPPLLSVMYETSPENIRKVTGKLKINN